MARDAKALCEETEDRQNKNMITIIAIVILKEKKKGLPDGFGGDAALAGACAIQAADQTGLEGGPRGERRATTGRAGGT